MREVGCIVLYVESLEVGRDKVNKRGMGYGMGAGPIVSVCMYVGIYV